MTRRPTLQDMDCKSFQFIELQDTDLQPFTLSVSAPADE